MIFRSIKWRLQLWYGLFLAVVLLAFGNTSYQLERDRQHRLIVDDFDRQFRMVVDSMQRPPPFPERPPVDFAPGDQPPPARRPHGLHLSPRTTELVENAGATGFYYVIWSPDGKELLRSTNSPPDVTLPARPGGEQMRGEVREFVAPVPATQPEFIVLVGRSIAKELKELRQAALRLTALGGFLLLVGLAGGWWLVGRAIRPIESISATAVKISAGDLSQRINVAETESELGQLAAVLNSTFARLETAFAQQQQFTADAAHELRTPVSVMLTQTQTALQRERNAAEYRETIKACQRASQRMRKLIESLLELARLDAGQEQLKRLKFDLSQTVRGCVELIKPLADERGVKIMSELAPLEIIGDAERLAQVITNLLANAVQYNKTNGEVRLSANVQDSMILLVVSDTGPGISREDLPHVFDRFYRADPSRSSGQTGLGLAISKAIVEAHGGSIEISSKENVGTTFTVRLPM
ncbi:MAG TPA: ATP-binding protein [Verrucomicrobiae bacterium]|nr:ATP-binding protein [Verrucomicrobiae bacterium]